MTRKYFVLSLLLAVFLSIAVYGVKEEVRMDIFNGAPYYLILVPSLTLTVGLFLNFVIKKAAFWQVFVICWLGATVMFVILLVLGMWHYNDEWQPEWYFFWIVISIGLFVLQGVVHWIGDTKKEK